MSEFNKDYLIENERMLSGETDRNVEQKQTGSDSEGKRVVPNSFIKEDMDGNTSVDSADLLIEEILREFSSTRSSKKVEEEELDDEVAKILKSVQESLDLEKERMMLQVSSLPMLDEERFT